MIPDSKNIDPTPESIVLDILSQKPRQTMKDLFEYFQKKYPKPMTLQGFYKMVKKMITSRVLVKEGTLVSIDATWIHNLINFSDTLKRVYLENDSSMANILLQEGESKTFTFEKVIDMDNFWNHALFTVIHFYSTHDLKDKNVYNYNHHSWFQLARTSSEQTLANAYQQMGMQWYLVSGSKTYLDTLVAQLIDANDFHYMPIDKGELEKPNYYFVVIGDFIFETAMPNYIYELMEKVYDRVRTIGEFNAQDILTLINQPGRTHLTISRDKKRAELLRKKIKEVFDG